MSPRRNRPRGQQQYQQSAAEDEGRYGLERTETWRGEEWVVRAFSAGGSGTAGAARAAGAAGATAKRYRCPGCDQEIVQGVPHVVAWPRLGDVAERRHWHRACWNARDRRSARPQRSRNAPRY